MDNQVIRTLREEYLATKKKLSRKGAVVAEPVIEALCEFCKQNSEFAQAVEQSGKKINECIEHVVKDSDSALSDLEAFRRAVSFYFEGATVHFQMNIDLGDGGFSNKPSAEPPVDKPTSGLSLSLDDLLF